MASVTPEITATVSPSGGGTWGIGFDYSIGKGWFEIDHLYGYRSNYRSNGNGTVKITVYDANGTQINTQSDYITLEFTKGGYSSDSLSYWKFNTTSGNCNHERVSGISTKTITVKIQTTSDIFNSFIKSQTWTYTITMPLYTNSIGHWAGGFKNSEGNNGSKTLFSLGSTYFDAWQGDSIVYDQARVTTIPKGYSVSTAMGSSSWEGSWTTYYMPATLTQPWGGTHMQYDYWPNTYNISYAMNGGTNNSSNPTGYNILYQAQLYNPTRTGYRFNTWEQCFSKGTVSFSASSGNYNYQTLHYNVRPGESFTVSIDSVSLKAGSTTAFSVLIHDFTTGSTVSHNWGGISSSKQWITVSCPSSSDSTHDYRLLIYAGSAGATANIAISYSNLQVHCKSSYINYGKNATFSSTDDLYTQLNLRNIGNVTATALWNANVYTIQYNANGGSGAPGNSSKTYDTAMTIPSTEPTRDGYDFLGWSTSSTATSATYTAGSSLSTDLSTTHGATVVLYAVWRELKVYVKVGGVWVEGSPYININGEWKRVVCVYAKKDGTWRPMG